MVDTERLQEVDAGDALAAAAEIGPFFTVEPIEAGEGWRSFRELVDTPALLRERVDVARAVLTSRAGDDGGAVPDRVVASIVFLGWATRLISPVIGAAVLGGAVPRLPLDELRWSANDGGPLPLAIRSARARRVTGADECVDLLLRWSIREQIEPLLVAFRTRFRLSSKVLWGNVASAIGGSVRMIGQAAPHRAETAARLAGQVLAVPPLAGTAELVQPDPAVPSWFLVRRSCCLFYRVPGAGTCGDCVLTPEAVRRRQWADALVALRT